VALETSRGWRIAKEKQSHKIDVVVALAMAALGAVRSGQEGEPGIVGFYRGQAARVELEDLRRARPAMPEEQRIAAVAGRFGMTPAELGEVIEDSDPDGPDSMAAEYERELDRIAGRSNRRAHCGQPLGATKTTEGPYAYCNFRCADSGPKRVDDPVDSGDW
jgi:hypothetical protein